MPNFLRRKDHERYHLHVWDGIPTYQLDLGNNQEELITIVPKRCF
ncbi:MAG: hypothetical protein ACJAZ9_001412 [Neolewinella sp.]|jgi:hypothetical protein